MVCLKDLGPPKIRRCVFFEFLFFERNFLYLVFSIDSSMPAIGSRVQVWNGTCHHTSGGLTKQQLMKNKWGRLVSKKKHATGKRSLKFLHQAGYIARKGSFGASRSSSSSSTRRRRRSK